MGYSFTFDPPSDGAVSGCAFNNWQMNYVRLVMVEAGAITGNGLSAALSAPGLETSQDTLPAKTFMHNGGDHVTATEATFIAGRLRRAVADGVVGDLLSFFDDPPSGTEVRDWVDEFAAFNELAATRDGYYVC
jgi:hypothetical protein